MTYLKKKYAGLPPKPSLRQLEGCAAIDMTSYFIDDYMVQRFHFPPDEYFSIENFHKRIGVYFINSGISLENANHYLDAWEADVRNKMSKLQ